MDVCTLVQATLWDVPQELVQHYEKDVASKGKASPPEARFRRELGLLAFGIEVLRGNHCLPLVFRLQHHMFSVKESFSWTRRNF